MRVHGVGSISEITIETDNGILYLMIGQRLDIIREKLSKLHIVALSKNIVIHGKEYIIMELNNLHNQIYDDANSYLILFIDVKNNHLVGIMTMLNTPTIPSINKIEDNPEDKVKLQVELKEHKTESLNVLEAIDYTAENLELQSKGLPILCISGQHVTRYASTKGIPMIVYCVKSECTYTPRFILDEQYSDLSYYSDYDISF